MRERERKKFHKASENHVNSDFERSKVVAHDDEFGSVVTSIADLRCKRPLSFSSPLQLTRPFTAPAFYFRCYCEKTVKQRGFEVVFLLQLPDEELIC